MNRTKTRSDGSDPVIKPSAYSRFMRMSGTAPTSSAAVLGYHVQLGQGKGVDGTCIVCGVLLEPQKWDACEAGGACDESCDLVSL